MLKNESTKFCSETASFFQLTILFHKMLKYLCWTSEFIQVNK